MCGIVGIFGSPEKPLDVLVRAMGDVFPYRGPDAEGVWVNRSSGVAFGHRRLSIIDISSAGNQPMSYAGGRLWITYNGEIYNYLELRRELEAKGHSFRTRTDTEVLLAAFCEWGSQCLTRLNGMWAFAIWDEKKHRLFLARDRIGIKPLYYYQARSCFYFASEVKSILMALSNKPETDVSLIDAYMRFGYVPGENSLFQGIKRVLPGHFLETDGTTAATARRYWDLTFQTDYGLKQSECVRESKTLLEDAIALRLRSDVPLGIFLSGGLDSSAVVGLLARQPTAQLKTFSVAYDLGPEFDETFYARKVANLFHTEHHEVFVSPSEFEKFIPEFVWRMDEPVTEAAAISLFFVSRLAKPHVTVVLSGEGADEVFAGYDLYRYMLILEKYRSVIGPRLCQKAASLAGAHFPLGSKIAKYLLLGGQPLENRYRGISTYDPGYRQLYKESFGRAVAGEGGDASLRDFLERIFGFTRSWDPLSRMLYFDLKTWLVDDLLIKADRMSMGASLELRVPFLDYRLVEFAARMPPSYKLHRSTGKFVLKKMMEGILPPEIIYRKKMGFPSPLRIMLKGPLQGYARDLLLSTSASTGVYFKRGLIERILREHAKGVMDHHRLIWQLVVLETWMQVFGGKGSETAARHATSAGDGALKYGSSGLSRGE